MNSPSNTSASDNTIDWDALPDVTDLLEDEDEAT